MRGQKSNRASPIHPFELKVIHWTGRMKGNRFVLVPGGLAASMVVRLPFPADDGAESCGPRMFCGRNAGWPRTTTETLRRVWPPTAATRRQRSTWHPPMSSSCGPREWSPPSDIYQTTTTTYKDNDNDDKNRFEQRQTHANKNQRTIAMLLFFVGEIAQRDTVVTR